MNANATPVSPFIAFQSSSTHSQVCPCFASPDLEHITACFCGVRPDISVLHTHAHTHTHTHTHTQFTMLVCVCTYVCVCVCVSCVCECVCVCVCACLCVCVTADITAGELIRAIPLAFFAGPGARALTSAPPPAPPVRVGCVCVCVCLPNENIHL
jgi:hypothetical protein